MYELGMSDPAFFGMSDVEAIKAATRVKMAWRRDERKRLERRWGEVADMRAKMNDPRTKARIDVPDLTHRQGCEYGCPVIPRPT